ncbi:hypothetical protein [Pantanalinema sp. GBBB05]|uniref:hypothetical protein n=1 Tax=Pantanalinema sp. GBBB05 TaxID=2604139 RepID=UPI001DCA3934|nr:hypothetical protein [Pantanalinema sp. GBBB05]
MKRWLVLSSLFLMILSITLVFGGMMHSPLPEFPSINQISQDNWQKLAQQRILFGHASVGGNIVTGIQELQNQHPEITLNLVASETPWTVNRSGLIHFYLGSQPHPHQFSDSALAKIAAFSYLIESRIKNSVDIALFKLCWADINSNTDVVSLFTSYKTTIAKLMQDFPQTTFVQVTTPLVAEPEGVSAIKQWLKRLLGKSSSHLSDNVKINQLNDLIRSEYTGKTPIFDLATIESMLPDGTRQTFSDGGKTFFSLVPEYTSDMGHLNQTGRRVVAEQFLVFLADVASQRSPATSSQI